MPSPQVEDGYTVFANELLEAMVREPFTKRQYKVMLHIARKTYGYRKKMDDMTVSQVARATGLTRPHASATIQELVDGKCVLKQDGVHGYLLGINKNYNEWTLSQNGTRPKTGTNRPETGHPPSRNGNSDRPETGHTKENLTKENPKRKGEAKTDEQPPLKLEAQNGQGGNGKSGSGSKAKSANVEIPDCVPKDAWKDFLQHRKEKRDSMTPMAEQRALSKLVRLHAEGHDPRKVIELSIENGWKGLFTSKETLSDKRRGGVKDSAGDPVMTEFY